MRRRVASTVLGVTVTAAIAGAFPSTGSTEPPPVEGSCAAEMSVEEQAGQVLLALTTDPSTAEATVAAGGATGVAPLGTLDAARADALDVVGRSGVIPPIVASDEEGGTVQRFRDLLGRLPSAHTQATTMTPAEVAAMYADYGHRLASAGVDMAFAPVVDIGGGPAIGDRSYGEDPAVVVEYAGAAIDGYLQAGIIPVLKHFPGHGRASADTHDSAATTPPLDALRETDLVPYESLLSAEVAVMVGHLAVPGLTGGMPATLSAAAIDGLLRVELGFGGLVISDALGMGAVRQVATPPEAAVLFLVAGGDLALVDLADVGAVRGAIVSAIEVGQLEPMRLDAAVTRVLRTKNILGQCAVPWDLVGAAFVRGVTDGAWHHL